MQQRSSCLSSLETGFKKIPLRAKLDSSNSLVIGKFDFIQLFQIGQNVVLSHRERHQTKVQ